MPSYEQVPGTLNLSFKRGDDVSALIDFTPADLTAHTVTSTIVSAVTGAAVVPFTVTIPSAADGQVNIALTDTQTASMARGTYNWSLTWTEGNVTRTALVGHVEVL